MNAEQTTGKDSHECNGSGKPGNTTAGRSWRGFKSSYSVEYRFTDEDYKIFYEKLWSDETPTEELEEICMILANVPTAAARELIENFRESDRATDIDWLANAVSQGKHHYLSPRDNDEERDFIKLKLLGEMMDEIIELEVQFNITRIKLEKLDIELEAVKELVRRGEVDKVEEISFHPVQERHQSKMENLSTQINVKDKSYDLIRKSIKTERYQNVDPMSIKDIDF